ncbi:MAG: hypothetical protein ACOC4L_04725 [Halanaerobium sp.]
MVERRPVQVPIRDLNWSAKGYCRFPGSAVAGGQTATGCRGITAVK